MNSYYIINNSMSFYSSDEKYYKTVEGLKEVQERLTNYLPYPQKDYQIKHGHLGEVWDMNTEYISPFNADMEVTATVKLAIFYDQDTRKIIAKKWVELSYESDENCIEDKEIALNTYLVENMTDYQVLLHYPFFQQFLRVLKEQMATCYQLEYESLNKSNININNKQGIEND